MVNPSSPSPPPRRCVLVCQHRSCERNGSEAVLAAFQAAAPPNTFIGGSGCTGQCSSGPTVRVLPDGTWYCHLRPADVERVVEQHLKGNQPVTEFLHPRFHPQFNPLP